MSPIGLNYYDIQAKAERPIAESQCRLLTQALLADRFKFAAHWESRDGQISDLVLARGGPKIQRALDDDKGMVVNIVTDGRPLSRPAAPGPEPKGWTMQELAEFLTASRTLQPIVDKTGLEGRYKIDLRFSTQVPANDQRVLDPELEAVLEKQLGLRLEKHKGKVDVFVVDHIEPPTPN